MNAQEARAIADNAKKQMLEEIDQYVATTVATIMTRVVQNAKYGFTAVHFKRFPDGSIPIVVQKYVIPLVVQRLKDDGFEIGFCDHHERAADDYRGEFDLIWS